MTQYCIYKADFTIFIKYLLNKLLSTKTDNEITRIQLHIAWYNLSINKSAVPQTAFFELISYKMDYCNL